MRVAVWIVALMYIGTVSEVSLAEDPKLRVKVPYKNRNGKTYSAEFRFDFDEKKKVYEVDLRPGKGKSIKVEIDADEFNGEYQKRVDSYMKSAEEYIEKEGGTFESMTGLSEAEYRQQTEDFVFAQVIRNEFLHSDKYKKKWKYGSEERHNVAAAVSHLSDTSRRGSLHAINQIRTYVNEDSQLGSEQYEDEQMLREAKEGLTKKQADERSAKYFASTQSNSAKKSREIRELKTERERLESLKARLSCDKPKPSPNCEKIDARLEEIGTELAKIENEGESLEVSIARELREGAETEVAELEASIELREAKLKAAKEKRDDQAKINALENKDGTKKMKTRDTLETSILCCPDPKIATIPGFKDYCKNSKAEMEQNPVDISADESEDGFSFAFGDACTTDDGRAKISCYNKNNSCVSVQSGFAIAFEGDAVCSLDPGESCSLHASKCAQMHHGIRIIRSDGDDYGVSRTLEKSGFTVKGLQAI